MTWILFPLGIVFCIAVQKSWAWLDKWRGIVICSEEKAEEAERMIDLGKG